MKICGWVTATKVAALMTSILLLPGPVGGQTASYLDFDALSGELRSLVNGSDLATMESLGRSVEGRDIWVVEVGSRSGTPLSERPGVLVVANLEGNHLVGSNLVLEALRHLLSGAEGVQEVLENQVFYLFPRLNPDGAEAMFDRVRWDRRVNARPKDDDNDGRVDEDGPEDLNGDGVITVMRVADPSGPYMVHPEQPRLMKRADPTKGESGGYEIYWEGTDSDGDGFYNEDGPGGVDLNRNFQHAYPYWQADAGPHMVSEVESRALMDFVIAHRNIAAILTFGETDNLVTPPDSRGAVAAAKTLDLVAFAHASNDGVFDVGDFAGGGGLRAFGGFGGFGRFGGGGWLRGAQPGRDNDPNSGRRPSTTVATQDQVYYTAVSDAYKSITGIQRVPVHRTPEGAFFDFGYFQYGVPSFSTPGWNLPTADPEGGTSPGGEAERAPAEAAGRAAAGEGRSGRAGGGAVANRAAMMAAARGGAGQARTAGASGADGAVLAGLESLGVEAFVDWTAFEHPTLGAVEIGGFRPYVTVNPPADQLPELGEKHGQFLVKLAEMLPRVRIAGTEVNSHGGGIFTVKVEVENVGFFPTSLGHGVTSRAVGPTLVQIQVPNESILTGADKTASVGVLAGSGNRESVTWIIQGRQGTQVEIKLMSQKAGHDTATVTLR